MRAYGGGNVGATLVKVRFSGKYEIEMPDMMVVDPASKRGKMTATGDKFAIPQQERTSVPANLNSKLSKIIHPFCCFKFQRHSKIYEKIQNENDEEIQVFVLF